MSNEVLANTLITIQSFESLFLTVAYLMGTIFVIYGLSKITGKDQNSGPKTGFLFILIGSFCLNTPFLIDLMSESLFGNSVSGNMFTANTKSNGSDGGILQVAVIGIKAVGLYAVIKAFHLWSQVAGGNSQQGVSSGLTYFISGCLCLNLESFAKMLGNSLGGEIGALIGRMF